VPERLPIFEEVLADFRAGLLTPSEHGRPSDLFTRQSFEIDPPTVRLPPTPTPRGSV
jgi:hypothetical protein